MCNRGRFIATLTALLIAGFSGSLSAENWPGWRGPGRNGVSTESNLPTHWNETEGIRWKTAVPGSGIANPIVWDDRIIVTDADGPLQVDLHVICYSREDGRELWHQRLWGTAPTLYHANKSSMASPAPVTDGRRIFAFFGTGDLFCLDMEGNLQWQRSLAEEYGRFENRFAASSSPLLYNDLVILQCDHYGDSYAIGIEQATGRNRWKTDRPEAWLSWASPQLVPTAAGGEELILCGSRKVDALDPASGKKLWTVGGMSHECIPTPVFAEGRLYVVSGPKSPSMAIEPGGRGDVTETHVRWKNTRGAPFVPSAILVGSRYYLVDDAGIATCLSTKDGRRVWQKRLSGQFTASPVAGDGKIYFVDESGQTTVISAESKGYKKLAVNPLGEPVYASPAISQGEIFIRTTGHLYCINGAAEEK